MPRELRWKPGELGAACCVYVGGRRVVDLWDGVAGREADGLADREVNRPWDEDTTVSPPRRKAHRDLRPYAGAAR
ncbi:hypothetical protein ACLMAL_39165 [Nocardia sp. CWNU-33]|uniref:hypothetical protein n=1 Tax=Nocardia sp. CWNU-33 TaxID=3392117 RepID=UPI00398F5414